jgi:hypothetical protein
LYASLLRPPLNWDELADVAAMDRFQGWFGPMWRKMSGLASIKLSFVLLDNVDLLLEFFDCCQVGDETLYLGIRDSEPR